MTTTIETVEYRGGTIEIRYDEYGGMNPREDETNLSRLVFTESSRWINPNEVDFPWGDYDYAEGPCILEPGDDPDDCTMHDHEANTETLAQWAVRRLTEDYGALYVIPVYRYEHGGIAYRVGNGNPFHDPWDSGQVGYAIVTPEGVAECGTPPELFAECVAAEVDRYSAWANGEVYYFVATAPNGESESLGGFIGSDEWPYMLSEGKAMIDWEIDKVERDAENVAADAMADLVAVIG